MMIIEADIAKNAGALNAVQQNVQKLQGQFYAKFHSTSSTSQEPSKNETETFIGAWPPVN